MVFQMRFLLLLALMGAASVASGQNVDSDGLCEAEGFGRDPASCNRFYRCVALGNVYQIYWFDCPAGTVFDETISVCNFPWASPPCDDSSSEEEEMTSEETVSEEEEASEETAPSGEGDKDDGEDTFVVVAPQFSYQCTSPGFFEHDSDCSKFWLCKQPEGNTVFTPSLFNCPADYLYDPEIRRCLPASDVDCDKTPDLGRIQFDPVPIQLRVRDLPAFYAQFATFL